jgi:DNA recombination protein RmuC
MKPCKDRPILALASLKEQTAAEILSLLGAFNKQWGNVKKRLSIWGKRIEDAKKKYDALITTRSNQLERPLAKIENLRSQKGIPEAPLELLPDFGEDE